VPASIQEDTKGLIRKVGLLEGELAAVCQAREVTEDKFRNLSEVSVDGVRRLLISEMERREQFEQLSLLWAWGAKLCFTITGPSPVRSPLSARMCTAAFRYTKMIGELVALWAAVSSTVELVLGRSPNETSQVEVTNELVTKFQRWEELCSWLEGPDMKICALLVGSLVSQARWTDHLDEATEWLEVGNAQWHQVNAKLDALHASAVLVRDLMLGDVDRPSSLAASLSMALELPEDRVDIVAANKVQWGTRSVLVAALSHFVELKSELELLGSRQNVDMTDDQAEAL
jgi:hypothetical protein